LYQTDMAKPSPKLRFTCFIKPLPRLSDRHHVGFVTG